MWRLRSRGWLVAGLLAGLVGAGVVVVSQNWAGATRSEGERAVFVPITPCRLLDTRPGVDNVGLRNAPLRAEETYDVVGRAPSGNCADGVIPAEATGLALNVTAVDATQQTNLRIFPAGAPLPLVSNMNPSPGAPPTPNAVVTDLASNGQFSIYNYRGEVHVIVDVAGYFVDHDHDDRYVSGDPIVLSQATTQLTPNAAIPPSSVANAARGTRVFGDGIVQLSLVGPAVLGRVAYGLGSVEYCIESVGGGAYVDAVTVWGARTTESIRDDSDRAGTGCFQVVVDWYGPESFDVTWTTAGTGALTVSGVRTTWVPAAQLN